MPIVRHLDANLPGYPASRLFVALYTVLEGGEAARLGAAGVVRPLLSLPPALAPFLVFVPVE